MLALAQSKSLSIAVPSYDSFDNFLESNGSTSFFLQSALTRTIVSYDQKRLKLDLASDYSGDPDAHALTFFFRKPSFFQNGRKITLGDIYYSLKRCQSVGDFPATLPQAVDTDDHKLTLVYNGEEGSYTMLFEALSHCPILEESSSEIFGDSLGTGTNFVSSGEFYIERFERNSSIVLHRTRKLSQSESELPTILRLRVVGDSERALAGLRAGRYDLILVEDQEVIGRAQKDETLLAQKCSIYSVAMRKGLRLLCAPRIRFSQLGYHGFSNSTSESHSVHLPED